MDYYSTQARRRRTQPPAWLWFFVGLMVGALAVGLIWMKQDSGPQTAKIKPPETKPAPKTAAKKESKPEKKEKQEAPKTNFEFYTVLPEMEVVIPDKEINKPTAPVTTPSPKKPDPIVKAGEAIYMLQMGSFRSYKDADRLKARLGLLGIEADIQSVTIDSSAGKKTTHRVRGGPYSRNQAHNMHEMLKKEKIDSIALRIKK